MHAATFSPFALLTRKFLGEYSGLVGVLLVVTPLFTIEELT